MVIALVLAVGILALAAGTGAVQVRGLRRLAARKLVPSDERAYFRSRHRRRLLTAGVMAAIGLLIGGAYLSGLERQADALAVGEGMDLDAPRPTMTDEQKQLFRVWSFYWAGVSALVLILVGLALTDALSTRRYWLGVYRALRQDHQALLRRDLAVYKQQVNETRNGRFKPGA